MWSFALWYHVGAHSSQYLGVHWIPDLQVRGTPHVPGLHLGQMNFLSDCLSGE